ncbi:MAG: Uma2 family endonuclease [Bacteroidetes bacterium]|nr:MAG: Uma2 family endonuclease [Bacteroidota bacterium]
MTKKRKRPLKDNEIIHKPDIVLVEKGKEIKTEDGELTNPVMVSEVFPNDREAEYAKKLLDYQTIPSLKLCVYIWEEKVQVDVHFREGNIWKKNRYQSLNDMIMMPHLGFVMPLAVIYEGIDFEKD